MPMQMDRVLELWNRAKSLPGGKLAFSKFLGVLIPYTGTARPELVELEPGRSILRLRDRRRVRNHLGSIHAIAMANVGEFAGGIAVTAALGPGQRTILRRLEVRYDKKARGTLEIYGTADASAVRAATTENRAVPARSKLVDGSGNVVAEVVTEWIVGPTAKK
jgi:acyl-coenzyme A thioesterase PaaI-like protein